MPLERLNVLTTNFEKKNLNKADCPYFTCCEIVHFLQGLSRKRGPLGKRPTMDKCPRQSTR